jgi:hypothetical protein
MALTTEPNLRTANSLYSNLAFEDLLNILEKYEPASTPVFSSIGSESQMGNTEFAWEVDSWASPNGAVGPGDGYAVQSTEIANVATNRRKMGNYGQAFRRVYGAGWIANSVPKLPGAGRGNLLANAATQAMVLLKQDIECAYTSFDQTATADVGGASGSTMAGIRKLVDYANRYTAASAFAFGKPSDVHYAPTGACPTGAMSSVLTLSTLKTAVLALRQATKTNKGYMYLCGLLNRQAITALVDPAVSTASATGGALSAAATQQRVFTQAIEDTTLGITIDLIKTDFGRLAVVPTDLIGTTASDSTGGAISDANRSSRTYIEKQNYAYILSPEKLAKRWGVAIEQDDLQNDGGGTNRQWRCYASLAVKNPLGFGFLPLT